MAGMKIVHITTTGRKTGKKRETELFSFEHEGEHVIIASNGGGESHPDWYFNLRKNPAVEIKIGKNTIKATARVTRSPLRDKLWAKLVKLSPHYATFEKKDKANYPSHRALAKALTSSVNPYCYLSFMQIISLGRSIAEGELGLKSINEVRRAELLILWRID